MPSAGSSTSYHDALLDAQARKLLRLSPAMRQKLIDRFYEGDDDRKQKMLDRLDELESGDDPKAYRNPGELLTELEQLEGEEPGAVPQATTGTAAKPATATVRKANDANRARLRQALAKGTPAEEDVDYERQVNVGSDAHVADEPPKMTVQGKGKRKGKAGNTLSGAELRAQEDRRSLLAKRLLAELDAEARGRRPLGEVEKRGTSEGARKGWLTRRGGAGGRQVGRASALDAAIGRAPRIARAAKPKASKPGDRRKAANMSLKDISSDYSAALARTKAKRSAKIKAGRKAGKAARARLGRTSQAYKNALARQAAKRTPVRNSKDRDNDRVIDDYRGHSRRGKVRKPATRSALLGG